MRLFAIYTFVLLSTRFCQAEVRITTLDYHGWRECTRLENGIVELIVAPKIGRIIRYSYVGGQNVLWENSELLGKTVASAPDRKEWANFGGDKVWNAPQDRWNWPPDPELDPGTQTITVLSDQSILMVGKGSSKTGIAIRRHVKMSADSTEVVVTNTIVNTSTSNQNWSVWEIAQVDDPETASIPRSLKGDPFVVLMDNKAPARTVTLVSGQVVVRRDSKKNGKVGTSNPLGMARSMKNGVTFEMRLIDQPGTYPDKECRQQIYWNDDGAKYVELELLGPIKVLRPDAAANTVVKWSLSK